MLSVLRLVFQADGLRLDGDAALALDIHGIEHLLDHVARGDGAGRLDQPVGERRFAMVDMRDDGEVANIADGMGGHVCEIAGGSREGKKRRMREGGAKGFRRRRP